MLRVSSALRPVCPAAAPIKGAAPGDGGVVCGVMRNEMLKLDSIAFGDERGVFLPLREDPSTVLNFCCGPALPVSSEFEETERAHHSNCPIWQMEKKRIAEGEPTLFKAPSVMRELATAAALGTSLDTGPEPVGVEDVVHWMAD